MPISHTTKVFAVTDSKIAKVLTDPAGGSATYATSIDVPGIKSIKLGGDIETKSLRGDNTLLDSDSVLTNVTAEVENAKLSLDVIAAMFGQTVVDSGTTPNQIAALDIIGGSFANPAKPAPFKLSGISASADVITGNVLIVLHKCVISGFPEFGLAEEDYQTVSFKVNAMPLLANGKWLSVSAYETATTIP
jgi:hypothetical protein